MSPLSLFTVYKKYHAVPARVRFFNIFRYFFTIPILEKFLVRKLMKNNRGWSRLIPPLYFYSSASIRRAERNGIRYELDIGNLIEHSIYFNNIRDDGWKNLLEIVKRDDVIIDVGANIGFLTLNFAKRCPEGTVIAFEPDSNNFQSLVTNLKLNSLRNVYAFQSGLGSRKEKKMLYHVYEQNSGANRFLDQEPVDAYRSELAEVQVFDVVVDTLPLTKIDLMKIDVEGFELFVIQGARESIRRYRPILFVELAEVNLAQQRCSPQQLMDYIEELGYIIRDAATMRDFDRNASGHHRDIVCFPKP